MDSSNISVSWTPPPLSSLNMHDCKAATSWAAAYIMVKNESTSALNVATRISPRFTADYLRSMIPSNWTSQPSTVDLMVWALDLWGPHEPGADPEYDRWADDAIDFPFKGCSHDICAKLDWQGDPDVSGIGMMVSYYVALILATLYFVVLAASRLKLINPTANTARPKGVMTRLIESFQESVNTFLDASLIFAAAMLGAAMVRYASVIRDPREGYSAYGLLGSVFMSAFSIFPALVLQAVADGPRTHFVRHFLWFAVIGFTIAVEVLYKYADHWLSERLSATEEALSVDHSWSNLCEDGTITEGIKFTLTVGHCILAVNLVWWFYYLVLAAIPQRWKDSWNSRPRECRTRWDWRTSLRIANGAICFVVACFFISLFHRYRKSIHQLTKGSDKDSDWQFGQVLALATWIPVGVDFCAIFFYGPERGMSGKISSHYRVVPNDDNNDQKGGTYSTEHLRSFNHTDSEMRG